jgi:methylglyoxal/glyoxal reductase
LAGILRLNTGGTMPNIGFGTWGITPGADTKEMVKAALLAGYRLIDTARAYGNEADVGEAIRESGIPREEIFVTTKLWNSDQGYESALRAFGGSLERLGLEYIDLYLIHWPATPRRQSSWHALRELYKSKRARSVGVSNYTVRHMRELLEDTDVVPAVNQIEIHPFVYDEQRPIVEFCQQHDIVVEAYSPLARGSRVRNPQIRAIAERLGKTPAQVLLRWCIQHDTVPLPRSNSTGHITENFAVFDFELSSEDMHTLDGMNDGGRVAPDPHKMR